MDVAVARAQAVIDYDDIVTERAHVRDAISKTSALPELMTDALPFGYLLGSSGYGKQSSAKSPTVYGKSEAFDKFWAISPQRGSADTPGGFTGPAARSRSFYDRWVGSQNFKGLFGEDWGDVDVDPRYLDPVVAMERGLDITPVAEELGIPILELQNNTKWWANIDGSMTRYYLQGEAEAHGARTDYVPKKGAPLLRKDGSPVMVSAKNMAVLNLVLGTQGTLKEQDAIAKLQPRAKLTAMEQALALGGTTGIPRSAPSRTEIQLELARQAEAHLDSAR
jgi:hypothetical protein